MWNSLFGKSSEEPTPTALEVTFNLNGKQVTVGDEIKEGTTLNTYIRDVAKLKGTKYMCNEGGCGACVVAATITHPVSGEKQTLSVNSCLVPVFACHGWDIKTVEGIGNKREGYHQVQANLASFNGTQCGFCSPGMVMNMYSLLADGKTPTMAEVENSFGGNICRCTGYRSILDAFKALASDATPLMKKQCADIEDLTKICSKTGKSCSGSCKKEKFEEIKHKSVKLTAANWYKVTSLDELFTAIGSLSGVKYQLSAGNTAEGVYRHYNRQFDARIDIKDVPELRAISTSGGYTVGANVTLTEAIAAFRTQANTAGYEYLAKLADHIDLVANTPVRNIGTLAGNLILKKDEPKFPSDLFVIFEAVGATLNILSNPSTSENVNLIDFLGKDLTGRVIQNISFPALDNNHYFRTFKIMPRKQNAHAYVSAGFLFHVSDTTNWTVDQQPRIVYCGINPDFHHATNTESYLVGKNLLDPTTVQEAISTLAAELQPDNTDLTDASPEYRKQVAQGVFYKFLLGLDPSKVAPAKRSGADNLVRPLSSGKQDFETNPNVYPLNQPIPKLEAFAQTAGEAEYTNDIHERPGELHGAFVLARQANSTIASIDASAALGTEGVVAFFQASDVPGNNSFTPPSMLFPEVEEVFCSGKVAYSGQVVGLIVATSRTTAILAAALVTINYAKIEKPVLSIKDVSKVVTDRMKVVKTRNEKKEKENVKEGLIFNGTFEIGAQYHMHMETQTCLVVPTEDGLDVYSATQWMDHVQQVIAEFLNIKESSINITVRRLGGGYGGKITRPALVAAACALAADKLGKPVRIVMSLGSNMEVFGKRFPYVNNYEVGVDSETGKISYINSKCQIDYGYTGNETPQYDTIKFFQNCYEASTFNMEVEGIRTDKATNAACRGPGTTEGVAFIEEIMEHVARKIKMDPLQVRLNNMPQLDNPLFKMIDDLKASADYDNRKANVQAFNAANRWKKRGMAIVPMQYRFPCAGNFSAMVAIYHGDGSVAISHGGIEMGQGLNTKVAQVAAHTLNIPLSKISVKPSNNVVANNGMVTGGSVGSENVSYAAMKSCQKLKERLDAVRESMEGDPTWEQVVTEAYFRNVELNATHMFTPGQELSEYNIWGATIAEVEVDILTGERQVLRVDLIEDVGQSLSPWVDVGQIEGAFVMGMGYWLSEELKYDPDTGRLLNTRTWNYKVPGAKDIPADFRINFRKNAANPNGLYNSKATGEPALNMTIVCYFALRDALDSARKDAGSTEDYYEIKLPATVETIAVSSLTDPSQFTLG